MKGDAKPSTCRVALYGEIWVADIKRFLIAGQAVVVDLPAQHRLIARFGIRDRGELDPVKFGRTFPIGGVGGQDRRTFGIIAVQPERSGADPERLCRPFRQNPYPVIHQQKRQARMRCGQTDPGGQRVHDIDPVDEAKNVGHGRFQRGVLDPLNRELHIRRIKGAAVVKGYARLQRQRPLRRGVVGRPGLCQFRCRAAIVALADQPTVDQVVHFVEPVRRDRIKAFASAKAQIIGAPQDGIGQRRPGHCHQDDKGAG